MLLLAPPNQRPPLRESLQLLWQNTLDGLQNFLTEDLKHVVAILIVAWISFWIVRVITDRMMRAAERHARTGLARTSQIRTLASVLRATGYGFIGFFAATSILRDIFDFNATPLLASAGVLGVAVGLAAQTIIKDMINGMLVLVEDQYNVGDWISIAGVSGTVESMSLRKTTVRGGDGTLNIIPNSQITIVSNQSRDYSTTTLNISVDFSADPEKVIALLKEVSLSVAEDPAYKDVFLEPPQVLGVDQIKGPEVIYLLNVKTQARRQYDAIREMQKRLRVALEQNHMLPGSPFRVAARSLEAHTATAPPPAAPSAAKPAADVNPFEPQA